MVSEFAIVTVYDLPFDSTILKSSGSTIGNRWGGPICSAIFQGNGIATGR